MREPAVGYGETVFTIGYPLADTPNIAMGIVNAPLANINGWPRILTSSQVVGGMSGGRLLDHQGRIVGIISGSLRTVDGIHLIVPAADLRRLQPPALVGVGASLAASMASTARVSTGMP